METFETIDQASLDTVNGGSRGRAIAKAGKWLWNNVAAPLGGGALYSWAADRLGGGNNNNQQQQQPAQPAQGQ